MKKYTFLIIMLLSFIVMPLSVRADGKQGKYCSYEHAIEPMHYIKNVIFIDDGSGKVLVKVNYLPTGNINEEESITHYNTNLTVADLNNCPEKVCAANDNIFYGIDPNGRFEKSDSCSWRAGFKLYSGGEVAKDSLTFDFIGQTGKQNITYESWLTGCFEKVGVVKLVSIAYDLTKVIAPIIMVLFATIDLAKAAAASDESQIKKAQKHCIKRIAAGIMVFLVLVCVELVVNLIPTSNDAIQCVKNLF